MTDLTTLVEAVAADVWAQQKDWPWDVQDPAVKHAAREAVLPFVAATVRHMAAEVADRDAAAEQRGRERVVASRALREAADDVYANSGAGHWSKPSVIAYLRDRADALEAGEDRG